MPSGSYHLAQINIGRLLAPLDDPQIADFVANLEPINAIADRAPGFVWRFQTDAGDATSLRPYDDDRMLINFSVWKDFDSLTAFTYEGAHVAIMRRRREWFERLAEAYMALWWIPAGHIPTVAEATARLDHLRRFGPTAESFSFRDPFPPPDAASDERIASLEDPCPAA